MCTVGKYLARLGANVGSCISGQHPRSVRTHARITNASTSKIWSPYMDSSAPACRNTCTGPPGPTFCSAAKSAAAVAFMVTCELALGVELELEDADVDVVRLAAWNAAWYPSSIYFVQKVTQRSTVRVCSPLTCACTRIAPSPPSFASLPL